MKNHTKIIALSFLLFTVLITGCKKDKDPKADSKISMKVTMTVTGADAGDQTDFRVTAGNHDASQYGAPVWKLNGTTQGNESVILMDVQRFTGSTKTYTLETVKPFDFGGFAIYISNSDGAALTVSYKAEINGKVETSAENLVISAGQSHSKNFTYQP